MPLVKALIGGLVGGCLGAYVVNMIGPVRGAAGPWLILLAGLGAGLGARLLCGMNRSFVTGIVSAVTAILGVALVSYLTAAVALRTSGEMESPLEVARQVEATMSQEAEDLKNEKDAAAETSEATEEPAAEEGEDATFVPPSEAPYELPSKTLADNVMDSVNATERRPMMDLIANAVSALLAFVIGTGSAPAAGPTKSDPEPA